MLYSLLPEPYSHLQWYHLIFLEIDCTYIFILLCNFILFTRLWTKFAKIRIPKLFHNSILTKFLVRAAIPQILQIYNLYLGSDIIECRLEEVSSPQFIDIASQNRQKSIKITTWLRYNLPLFGSINLNLLITYFFRNWSRFKFPFDQRMNPLQRNTYHESCNNYNDENC